MRKILSAICFLVASFTPTFANPPLCEARGRYQVSVMAAQRAEEAVQAEPSIYLLTEPRKVRTFQQLYIQYEEKPGEFRMVIHSSPPAPDWAKVSESSD